MKNPAQRGNHFEVKGTRESTRVLHRQVFIIPVNGGEQHQKFAIQQMKNATQVRNHLEVKGTRVPAQQEKTMRDDLCYMKISLIVIEQALAFMINGQSFTLVEVAETRVAKQGGMKEGDMEIKSNSKRGRGREKPLTSRVPRGLVKENILRPLTGCPPNELNAMQSMKFVEYVTRTPLDRYNDPHWN